MTAANTIHHCVFNLDDFSLQHSQKQKSFVIPDKCCLKSQFYPLNKIVTFYFLIYFSSDYFSLIHFMQQFIKQEVNIK